MIICAMMLFFLPTFILINFLHSSITYVEKIELIYLDKNKKKTYKERTKAMCKPPLILVDFTPEKAL